MGKIPVWALCKVCDRESSCVHDAGAFCGACCPYEQAVRAARAYITAKQHPALRTPSYALERFREAQNAVAEAERQLADAVDALKRGSVT